MMPKRRKKVDLVQKQVREIYQIEEEDETLVSESIEQATPKENGLISGEVV
jgi:hypothetical protein